MYLVRFDTRCCTSPSCPPLRFQNNDPHTGMSLDPCAGRADSPRMEDVDFQRGILPSVVLAQQGKVGGRNLQRAGRGTAAFAVRSMANGTVCRVHVLAGYRRRGLDRDMLDDFLRLAWVWSCAATVQAHTIRAVNIKISFFIDIAFSPFPTEALFSELETHSASKSRLRCCFRLAARYCARFSIPDRFAPEQAWISSGPRDRSQAHTY